MKAGHAPRAAADRCAAPVRAMLALQSADGAIPWFEDGPWDAWNHGECVMALGSAGEGEAARRGLDLLAARQQPDGAWLGEYGNAVPMADHVRIARARGPQVRDTNFTAYVATVVLHRHRLDPAPRPAHRHWPMVRAAIDHVVAHQHPDGDVSWCAEAHGTAIDDALVAGNASIFASLGHAIALAGIVGVPCDAWIAARARLGACLRDARHRFDRAGADRAGFAMDWYYPVLAGVATAAEGRAALAAGWPRFVDEGLGCRCVVAEPWVTVAETCELAMAAARIGRVADARRLIGWADAHRDEAGALWMGWQHAERIVWPAERPSWTQAAYVLAVDAVEGRTPAGGLLIGR